MIAAFARRIIGWRAARSTKIALVLNALEHAFITRGQAGITDLTGLVSHSDAGSVGGFDRSSEHLYLGVSDGETAAGCRSCAASEDAFAGQVGFPRRVELEFWAAAPSVTGCGSPLEADVAQPSNRDDRDGVEPAGERALRCVDKLPAECFWEAAAAASDD